MRWDLMVMLIAIWNCISIPFDVAFEPHKGKANQVFDTLIDICFFLDIALAFNTSFVNEKTGFEVFSYKLIAWNYIKNGQFFIDLGASIPFDSIYKALAPNKKNSNQIKALGLLKLVRLLRLRRIIRYLNFKQGIVMGVLLF